MDDQVHIGEAARRLSVTPHYLRLLESQGRIPRARRDNNGRVFTESDLALIERIGVGSGQRLKSFEDLTKWLDVDE